MHFQIGNTVRERAGTIVSATRTYEPDESVHVYVNITGEKALYAVVSVESSGDVSAGSLRLVYLQPASL